jgi:hypothetical protein
MPEDYEEVSSKKNYWRLPKMQEGDNRFRIVSRPIAGWIDWKDNKPLRYRPLSKPKRSVDPSKPMRPFWTCVVWDYLRRNLFVLEITQSGVIKQLEMYGKDPDWGDFSKYDLKIKKEGSNLETKYTVTAVPHKPMEKEIIDAIAATPINLNALYSGGDPWTDLEESPNSMKKEVSLADVTIGLEDAVNIVQMIGDDINYANKILDYYEKNSFEEIPAIHLNTIIEKVKIYVAKKEQEAERAAGMAPWEAAHA